MATGRREKTVNGDICLVIPQACPRGLYYLNVSKWLADILSKPKSPWDIWFIRQVVYAKRSLKLQFSSVAQSCPTLWDPTDCSTPGFPVLHHLMKFAQTHVHWVGDAIQPSHPSVVSFSSCLQSSAASGSFQMRQLFTSGGQRTGASASALDLLMSILGCASSRPAFYMM